MTKSTITPGTWIIHREKDSEKRRLSVVSDGRTFVCDLQWQVDDRELANAQAIAAVPDMIEALKLALAVPGPNSRMAASLRCKLHYDAMDKIEAALRKAGQIE